MFGTVLTFLLLSATIIAQPAEEEATLTLLEQKLQSLYDRNADSEDIMEMEAQLSDLYNAGEEDEPRGIISALPGSVKKVVDTLLRPRPTLLGPRPNQIHRIRGTESNMIENTIEQTELNSDLIDKNSLSIEKVTSLLSELNTKLDAANAANAELKTQFNTEIKSLKAEMADRAYSEVPIGTIAAWTNHVAGGVSVKLPDGWVQCNGQTISEGIWKDRRTPKINEESGRFLRGAPLSDVLQTQEATIKNMYYWDRYVGIYGCHSEKDVLLRRWEVRVKNDRNGDDSSCMKKRSLNDLNSRNVGSETRPKAMKVTYIIKIK